MAEEFSTGDADNDRDGAGWRVLDPDGNVIASGPCIVLDAVSDTGEEQ